MGTRSYIGITKGDKVRAIYCHWDGFISFNGVRLDLFYDTPAKIEKLLSYGFLSSLGCKIDESMEYHPKVSDYTGRGQYHTYANSHVSTDFCTHMARKENLKEKEVEAETFDLKDYANGNIHVAYVYLFDREENKWYVLETDKKGKPKKYELHLLLTNKEYYYNYQRETGNDNDKWIDIRMSYSSALKQKNNEETVLEAYTETLKEVYRTYNAVGHCPFFLKEGKDSNGKTVYCLYRRTDEQKNELMYVDYDIAYIMYLLGLNMKNNKIS